MDRPTATNDLNHRRESYHTAPLSSSLGQERRRKAALDAQKQVRTLLHYLQNTLTVPLSQRRTHAIEAARSSFLDLDFMEDLSLSGASSDDDTSVSHTLPPVAPVPSTASGGGPASPVISKTRRKAFKPRFKAWAKNLLSHPETLDLRHGLPEGLESEWRAVVCPKGKRCLVATSTDGSECPSLQAFLTCTRG